MTALMDSLSGLMASWGPSLVAKATVTLVLALLAVRLARHSRAAVRHLWLTAGFVVLLALPLAAALIPAVRVEVTPVSSVLAEYIAEPMLIEAFPVVSVASSQNAPVPRVPRWTPTLTEILAAVWLGGLLVCALPVAVGAAQVRRFRRNGLPWLDGQRVVSALASEAGLRRPVDVALHESIGAPATCGISRHAILFPIDVSTWSGEDIVRAAVHELEHVRRADCLVNAFARVMCAVYWFHPLAWVAWRRLGLEAERACDDAVLRKAEATTYADQLVTLAARLSANARHPMLAMANRNDLVERVAAVLDQRQARGRVGLASGAVIMLAAFTSAIALSPLQAVSRAPGVTAAAAAQVGPGFDVADVHVSAPRPDGRPVVMEGGGSVRGGRYEIFSATLLDLIRMAYGVDPDAIVGGPTWMAVDRFDVIATTSQGTTAAAVHVMLQSLLADRFTLVIRNDMRPRPAWVLSKGTGQPKLKRPTNSDASGCSPVYERERLSCRSVTMDAFVAWLRSAPRAMLPVLNLTGLEGEWDFDLEDLPSNFVRGVSDDSPILKAIDRQLGLTLARQSVPQPVIVVESANRTPTPNVPDIESRLRAGPVEFEVASIRPCEVVEPRGWSLSPSGHVNTGCQTLRLLIGRAWNLFPQQDTSGGFRDLAFGETPIEGPRSLDAKKFEIAANSPVALDSLSDPKYLAMLRHLLTDRFKMRSRYDMRMADAYTLLAAAPKLEKPDPEARSGCPSSGLRPSPGAGVQGYSLTITCQNATIGQFVEALNKTITIASTRRRVVDETGIEGTWDLTFSYRLTRPVATAPGEAVDPASVSVPIDQAIEQQLGLELKEARRPLPVFVIDHIEESPTEN